jgi:hypothetical protein
MNKNNGGPAFPMPTGHAPALGVEEWNRSQVGMTLRDYFAAAALQGLLAAFAGSHRPFPIPNDNAELPDYAYRYADAMLIERSKIDPS